MLALSSSENLQTAKQIKISASREKTQIYLQFSEAQPNFCDCATNTKVGASREENK